MSFELDKQDNFEYFAERYVRPRTSAVLQVERTALGHHVGLNGYTTVEQADTLHDFLNLSHRHSLLDLGAGLGWPGLHIAQKCGCRLALTDIPLAALRQGRLNAKERDLSTAEIVAADGRALPFQSKTFDGIVHTDVFC